jgi:predicted nucleic acid-binding protein
VIFVDSNVLIDVLDRDPIWADWSAAQLHDAVGLTSVAVSQIVVAEVGPQFDDLDAFAAVLTEFSIRIDPLTDEAAFVAGQAFRRHRRFREGPKSILADFLIGGQAAVAGGTILTRDPAVYSTYFPDVPLICPEKGPA